MRLTTDLDLDLQEVLLEMTQAACLNHPNINSHFQSLLVLFIIQKITALEKLPDPKRLEEIYILFLEAETLLRANIIDRLGVLSALKIVQPYRSINLPPECQLMLLRLWSILGFSPLDALVSSIESLEI